MSLVANDNAVKRRGALGSNRAAGFLSQRADEDLGDIGFLFVAGIDTESWLVLQIAQRPILELELLALDLPGVGAFGQGRRPAHSTGLFSRPEEETVSRNRQLEVILAANPSLGDVYPAPLSADDTQHFNRRRWPSVVRQARGRHDFIPRDNLEDTLLVLFERRCTGDAEIRAHPAIESLRKDVSETG